MTIHGAQLQDILFAQTGNGAVERSDAPGALAEVSRNGGCKALVGRLVHESKSLLDALFRDEVQEWRLFELHRQTLPQRFVKHRITGPISKIGENNGVLLGQLALLMRSIVKPARHEQGNG